MELPTVILYTSIGLVVVLSIALYWLYQSGVNQRNELEETKKTNEALFYSNRLLEAEQLKFQLQPHTLNNILANLRYFSKSLHRGMESLSDLLDYILYRGKNHRVSIQDEIEFLESYLKLNNLFTQHHDAIQLDTNAINKENKHFNSPCIPHLITAYLIENAFKHGDKDHPNFLQVYLTLRENEFKMRVINRIKHGFIPEKKGIGLQNMRKRLDILNDGHYTIENSCNEEIYETTLSITLR